MKVQAERQIVADVLWWSLRDAGVTQATYADAAGISLSTAARRLAGVSPVYVAPDLCTIADLCGLTWAGLTERVERALGATS